MSALSFSLLSFIGNPANQSSYSTSGSYTPPANTPCFVFVESVNTVGTAALASSYTGNGITWNYVTDRLHATNQYRMTVFVGFGAAPTTGSGTVNFGGVVQQACNAVIVAVTGGDTSSTVVQSGSLSQTSVGAGAYGVTLSPFADVNNAALLGIAGNVNSGTDWNPAASSGFSFVGAGWNASPNSNCAALFSPTEPSSDFVDATRGSGTSSFVMIAIEVRNATPTVPVRTATLAVTNDADSFATSTAVALAASVAVTNADDSAAAAATLPAGISLTYTEIADSTALAAGVAPVGALAGLLEDDTAAVGASASPGAILAVSEAGDAAIAAVVSSGAGDLAALLADDVTLLAIGARLAAALAMAESDDTAAAVGLARSAAALLVQLEDDAAEFIVSALPVTFATLNIVETADAFAGALAATAGIAAGMIESADGSAFAGGVAIAGSVQAQELADSFVPQVAALIGAGLDVSEEDDYVLIVAAIQRARPAVLCMSARLADELGLRAYVIATLRLTVSMPACGADTCVRGD